MPRGREAKARKKAMKMGGDHTWYHMRGEQNRGRASQKDSGSLDNQITGMMSTHTQSPFEFEIFERMIRNQYEKYTGENAMDTSVGLWTREQQIERYAKSLAFWEFQKIKHDKTCGEGKGLNLDTLAPKDYMISTFLSQCHLNMFNRINDVFDGETQDAIFNRAQALLDELT